MAESEANWDDIIVSPDTTLHRAIEILNSTGKMFLIIADPNQKLLGNLTDGDLRKGLLKNSNLSAPIHKFMNCNTKTVLAGTSTDKVALIFENEDVNAIPIVNKENIIRGCYFRSNFNKNYKQKPRQD